MSIICDGVFVKMFKDFYPLKLASATTFPFLVMKWDSLKTKKTYFSCLSHCDYFLA